MLDTISRSTWLEIVINLLVKWAYYSFMYNVFDDLDVDTEALHLHLLYTLSWIESEQGCGLGLGNSVLTPCRGQNLHHLGLNSVSWVSVSATKSWVERLLHIPWFAAIAGCRLPQWDDCDRHCDVQAMANTAIIFVICVILLCLLFFALNEHSRDVALFSTPWSSGCLEASDSLPWPRLGCHGLRLASDQLEDTSVSWVIASVSAWKAWCTSLSISTFRAGAGSQFISCGDTYTVELIKQTVR